MARQGYDDTDNIEQVAALMLAEPGLTRHAAIKRVVGSNRSNIRRIEVKMASVVAEEPAPLEGIAPIEATPGPAATLDPRTEARFLIAGLVLVGASLSVWAFLPRAFLHAVMGLSWIQLKIALLTVGLTPSGASALAFVEGYLAHGPTHPIDGHALLELRRSVGENCRAWLAAGTSLAMAWSVHRLASLPQVPVASPDAARPTAPTAVRLLGALREPRNGMVATVLLGGLGCTVPAFWDFATMSIIVLTWALLRDPAPIRLDERPLSRQPRRQA